MPNHYTRSVQSLAFALVVFAGRLVDVTTGQPLPGVRIVLSGPSTSAVTSDRLGRFSIKGLKTGSYTVTMQGKDVPQQRASVQLRASITVLDLKVCSATLDYHCGDTGGGAG
jgi:Carboxypeptidase regulatory-like domain